MEDKKAISFFGNVLHTLVKILNISRVFFSLHILLVHISTEWTRTVDTGDSGDINDVLGLRLLTKVLRSVLCELEDTCPLALVKDILVDLLVC